MNFPTQVLKKEKEGKGESEDGNDKRDVYRDMEKKWPPFKGLGSEKECNESNVTNFKNV